MKKELVILVLLLSAVFLKAQVLSYGNSPYHKNGMPGDFLIPELKITNTAASTVQVFVNRIQQNLPQNWAMCYCFIQCHPPSLDSLRFNMQSGETVTIGIGFTTDQNAGGYGSVKITVTLVNGSQIDTLDFSGNTLVMGLAENQNVSAGRFYPCPVSDYFNYNAEEGLDKIQIMDSEGRVVEERKTLGGNFYFDMSMYKSGAYYLREYYLNGKTKEHKFIKN